jgi:hypothetical protein
LREQRPEVVLFDVGDERAAGERKKIPNIEFERRLAAVRIVVAEGDGDVEEEEEPRVLRVNRLLCLFLAIPRLNRGMRPM